MYITYGEREISYLKKNDKRLGKAIDQIGKIQRARNTDLFSSLIRHIIGQQISVKAQETVWNRLLDLAGVVSADNIIKILPENLKKIGISRRKADYIYDFVSKVHRGDFDIRGVYNMDDEDLIKYLVQLRGVGRWTAEMLMIFSLERPDILSYDDLAIRRGIMMLYGHKELNKKLFEKYRKRYSPYGTVASLYLWEIASSKI